MVDLSFTTIPGTQPFVVLEAGRTLLGSHGADRLFLQVWERRRTLGDWHRVDLTTGGTLERLKGQLTVYRGKSAIKWGDVERVGAISHYPARDVTGDGEATDESFAVNFYLEDRLFDEVVRLGETGRPISVSLHFGIASEAVKFGPAPDGSEVVWDTEQHSTAFVDGVTVGIALAPTAASKLAEEDVEKPEEPVDPRAVAPSSGLLLDGYAEIFKRLELLQAGITSLRTTMIFLGVVMMLAWALLHR